MPRHSLADKEREWHELEVVRANLETNIKHFVAVGQPRTADLLRKKLKVTKDELERLRLLMWRDIEKSSSELSFKRTLKAIESIESNITLGRVNSLLK